MAIFYAYPLNYSGGRSQYREVADNDYSTFTTSTSMLLHIDTNGDGAGTARDFTDIFIKATGVARFKIELTDPLPSTLTFPDRTLPETVINDSGDTVPTVVDGYQHDLHDLWQDESTAKPQAKSITLTFTGTSPKIYEVMVLDRLLTLNSDGGFSRVEYDNIDLGDVEPDLRGRLSYVPSIGGERDKWLVNLTLLSLRTADNRDTLADQINSFKRRYKNFVLAAEPKRYPERVFPAVWPDPTTQIRYLSRWKGSGRSVRFSVREA